jgi:SdrD B-like domain
VNGTMTEFNAALNSSFTVAGLVIDVDDMAMNYTADEFAMYGTVTVNTTGISFTGQIGDPSTQAYGLFIDDNVLESLGITITSTVSFGDLTMTAAPLAFNYNAAPEEFTLYGNVSVAVAGVNLSGNLGNASLPGLTIVNGALTELNLGVSANFTLFGLTCDVQALTFQYFTSGETTEYIMFGSLSLSVGQPGSSASAPGETISATLGTSANPGMILDTVANVTTVQQINMAITGSFGISGFGFSIVDAGCDYTASNDQYLIFGTFTLTDVFTASVQLGTNSSNPGITISDGNFFLDNFSFDLTNVPMGAFTLTYVDISYASAGNIWSGAAQVTFPTGWSISAGMTFVNGILDDINLSYSAGTSPGIEIPDTGIFVTEISGSLENLDDPAQIIVSGSIQAVYGDKITIGGTTCTIFAATGSFTADSQELVISGNYYEGAVDNNGNWTGILGTGSASVDLDWAAGVYTADVNESYYDGTFVTNESLAFNDSGDLGIIATASVNVPDAVPFIGGTQLGSMSFAFVYTASSNTGSVAAWINVNLYFTTVTTGFEYNFSAGSSGSFGLIGAGGVNSIKNAFNSISSADANTPTIYVYSYAVTVAAGSGSDGLSVQATWPANSGTQTLEINGPNDNTTYYSLSSPPPSSDNDEFLTQYTTTTSQSVITNGSETNATVLLSPGTYNCEIQSTYAFGSTSDVVFTNQLYYQPPTVAITSVPSSALTFVPTLTGSAAGALQSNTTITLYAQIASSGYSGSEVGSFGFSVNSGGQLQNVPPINLSDYSPGVPIYIYAIINDGTNSAVYSALSSKIIPVPNLVGQVLDQFGNPIAGITVFLDLNDDGIDTVSNVSGASTTLATDPSTVTNANGNYYFNNLAQYLTTDVYYSEFRVTLLMPSPSFTPILPSNGVYTIDNDSYATSTSPVTDSIVASFTVNRLASVAGSVYSDLNQDGVYTASDPELAGATVYLDASGSGTYQAGDATCVTGPSGTFGFYDISVPDVGNSGFESPTLVPEDDENDPTGTDVDWTFTAAGITASAGIAGNNSPLTSGNAGAPQGDQVAYMQGPASISQTLDGFEAGQAYYISFDAANQAGNGQSSFTVSYNGTVIGTFSPTNAYELVNTHEFSPGAGPLTLTFTNLDPDNAGLTSFLDNVQIIPAIASATTFTVGMLNSTTESGMASTVNSGDNYVVTSPSSGTYAILVSTDASQLTGYTFGAISLATVSGSITSEGTASGSSASVQSGTTVDISTPNLTASVPSFANFSSTTGLSLKGPSITGAESLELLSSSQSDIGTAAWYQTAVPILGGFETEFQWSMTSADDVSGGFGFVIQNSAIGSAAKGSAIFGSGEIAPGIAVLFDPSANEMLVESASNSSTSEVLAVLTSQQLGFTLNSGTVYTTRIVFQPTTSSGQGVLSIYLSGDSSGGQVPLVSTAVNLATVLDLGSSGSAFVGFAAGTSGTGLSAFIDSWTFTAVNTVSTTTNASGNYIFTGVYPTSNNTGSVPNYPEFTTPSGMAFVGPSSVTSSDTLQLLSSSDTGVATAAWYTTPVSVEGGFETEFQWTMSGGATGGFSFVLQNSASGTTAKGATSSFGYGGIDPGIAVVFDAVSDEVLIEDGGDSSSPIATLTSEQLGFSLASGTLYSAKVVFEPTGNGGAGTLVVYLTDDGPNGLSPVLSIGLNLAKLLDLGTTGTAIVGFTATTSVGLAASINSWTMTSVNTGTTATTYTVSQVLPVSEIQATPFNTKGVYSQLNLASIGEIVSSVATGDVNGDGNPDVAYAVSLDVAPYEIAYALGNGQGGFGNPVLVSLPVPAGSPTLASPTTGGAGDAFIAAGTFGSESYDDIAYVAPMASGGDVVVVYDIHSSSIIDLIEITSSGAGSTFGANLPSGADAWTINDLAVGDLINDGNDDLAISVYGGVFTLVNLQNITSTSSWSVNPATLANPFGTPALLGNSSSVAFDDGVAIGDFNQDGELDLVTIGVQYIPAVGNGVYGPYASWSDMTVASTIQLAYGNGSGNGFTVQNAQVFQDYTEQNIDQFFSSSGSAPAAPIPFAMTIADVKSSGIPGLVLNGYSDTLQPAVIEFTQSGGLFTNVGDKLFPNGISFNAHYSSLVASEVVAIDLNGDGFADIAAVDPNVGQIMLLTTADAPLTTSQTQTDLVLAEGALPQFVAADFSQDGYPDLVSPGANDGSSQSAPVIILNGTINVGTITLTLTNGEILTGQSFADINFSDGDSETGTSSASDQVQPQLASASSVTIGGQVYLDRIQNGRKNPGDQGLSGLTIYIDANHSGQFDPAIDPFTTTDSLGYYSFAGLVPGQTYLIGIANLPAMYSSAELMVSTPAASETEFVNRDVPIELRWSLPQATQSVYPLTPTSIDLSSIALRESLGFTPRYMLVGTIPDGMTIDPYTGQILWTPTISDAGTTLSVSVQIENSTLPSALQSQVNQFDIQVIALTATEAYVRGVFGALLDNVPTPAELAQWTNVLNSGESMLKFVTAIANTPARYQILIDDTYLTILDREPTSQEDATALQMLQSGGNSGHLTQQLLTSASFMQKYPNNRAFVNAVNQSLTTTVASPRVTAQEVAWLRAGRSRKWLVQHIYFSHTATMTMANQLAVRYLGQPTSLAIQTQWAKWLADGTLNPDSLTIRILASNIYFNGSTTRVVPNVNAPNTSTSAQYNRLAHLEYQLDGVNPSRAQLDSLESELYNGMTWKQLARNIYTSQAATDARIETQFQNLLQRQASSAEMASLAKTLPAANQSEALQIEILSGSEYRSRFSSTISYVISVYQVLTGSVATLNQAIIMTYRIGRGLSLRQFAHDVATSSAGRTSQVQRLYYEYLDRDPSASELKATLKQFPGSTLQDQPIAYSLINSSEFQSKQVAANLLPVASNPA